MVRRGASRQPSSDLTRQERRDRRLEAERRRLPKHGKGFGLMVRDAITRRDQQFARAGRRRDDAATRTGRTP